MLLGRKAMTKLDKILKSRDIILPAKEGSRTGVREEIGGQKQHPT